MDPQTVSQSRAISSFGPGDRKNLSTMSIPELISVLRATFMKRDFNIVEETLVSREATLKEEIEKNKLVIGLLQERVQFERLEKIRVESELKKVKGEKAVESEIGGGRSKVEVLKNKGVDNVAVVKVEAVEAAKVEVLGEKKGFNGEPSKENCLATSAGQTLGKGTIVDVRDSNQDAHYSQATFNKKETTERQSSSGEVQKNLATRLAKPVEITPKNDFNQVEKTLVAKGRVLKADIEKKKENGLQQEKNQFKRLERSGSDIQLKTVKAATTHGEKLVKNVGENGNGFGLDDSKVVRVELVHKGCKPEGLRNRQVANGKAGTATELEGEKVEVLAEKKRLVGELIQKDGLGASAGGRLAIRTVVDIEDSDEEECNSQEALNTKQTTSRVTVDNDRNRSSGACQTDLATTRMVGSTGTRKRQFASPHELVKNIKNVLDGLDDVSSSSSSSSSSSGEVDMDIPFRSLTSNKKMRTGATNL